MDVSTTVVPIWPGMVTMWASTTLPSSAWLMCDGSAVSRNLYPGLFAAIGTTHGAGDGTTTFNLPDLRGRFVRGVDGGTGRDPDAASRSSMNSGGNTGNAVGSVQGEQFKQHNHTLTDPGHTHSTLFNNNSGANSGQQVTNSAGIAGTQIQTGSKTTGISIADAGGNETRPTNAYLYFIIKT